MYDCQPLVPDEHIDDQINNKPASFLSDVHYNEGLANYGGITTVTRIRSFWLIAGFVLLIACINFVNISTAQAVNRAREVGVRKVLGGGRWQLRIQFLLEASCSKGEPHGEFAGGIKNRWCCCTTRNEV